VRNQFLRYDMGPSRNLDVQWATFGDMADASAISRVYTGVHAPADELVARQVCARAAGVALLTLAVRADCRWVG
jgi:hypothetical protein